MSATLEELKAKQRQLKDQAEAIHSQMREIDAEILRIETEASPWRVGMVLQHTYRTRRQISSMRWEDGPMRTERAVVVGTQKRWDRVEPVLRRLLKDGSLGKQNPYYYNSWKPTGETVEVEES